MSDYVQRVISEIRITFEHNKDFIHYSKSKPNLFSLYLGGGTPSLLPLSALSSIFKEIKKFFTITNQTEITIECNPETLNKAILSNY